MDCTFVCLAGYRASTTSSTVRASPEKRLPTKISAQGTDTGNGEYFLADLRHRPKGTCFGYHVFARLISKSLSYYVFFYNMSDAAAIVSCDLYSYLRCILGRSFRPGLIWTIHPTRESKRGHDRRLPIITEFRHIHLTCRFRQPASLLVKCMDVDGYNDHKTWNQNGPCRKQHK